MRRLILSCITAGIFWLVACNDEFQPVAGYSDRLAVVSILSNQSDTQYVRVNTTYNAYGQDDANPDHPVVNASVYLTDGTKLYAFRDTVIRSWSDSGSVMLKTFIAPGAKLTLGKTYSLVVSSPGLGTVTASTAVPGAGLISTTDDLKLKEPFLYDNTTEMVFIAQMTGQTKGYIVRLYLDYELAVPGVGWNPVRMEIPTSLLEYTDIENYLGIYPSIAVKRSSGVSTERVIFHIDVYKKLIKGLRSRYKPGDINFKTFTMEMYQYEENLYKYYSIATGFRDQFSIRTDLPNYSNISGGVGLFGAYTKSFQVIALPDNIGL